MTDALAEAVAKAEAELAAMPEHLWLAVYTKRGNMQVTVLAAYVTSDAAKERCAQHSKGAPLWTPSKRKAKHDTIFNTEYMRVLLDRETHDVRYTIMRIKVHPT